MKREMTDTQYGFLYKMSTGWRTTGVLLESKVWQAYDHEKTPERPAHMSVSRSRVTTLNAVHDKGWVRHYEMGYPLVGWELTAKGFAALQNEQVRRGATLKGMELK